MPGLEPSFPHPHYRYLLLDGQCDTSGRRDLGACKLVKELERREPSTSVMTVILTRWDWERWGMAPQDVTVLEWKGVRDSAWKTGMF